MSEQGRTKWLHIRVSAQEYQKISGQAAASTSRKMSEYIRRVLLHKPITIYRRNQSLDDFMAEMIRLRRELSALGNNYNQLIKRLHVLHEISGIESWLQLNENARKILQQKVDEIHLKIAQINDQWLQE